MSMILDGSNGVTFNDASLQGAAASPYVLKNRIINGDMVIDQRNAGASVTINAPVNIYSVDRWRGLGQTTDGVFTLQQDSSAPTGFINSLKATVTTQDSSIGSTQVYFISQGIEGYNIADLGWGTANAKTVTLSFWVRSSLTGTFGGAIRNNSVNRSYPWSYTISSSNTWEYKTIIIPGDTTGTWLTDVGTGMIVQWSLGAGTDRLATAGSWVASNNSGVIGQVQVISTNGATLYITGVQLEQNTSATPFERRLFNQELANCQRYYQVGDVHLFSGGGNLGDGTVLFPVQMRTSPTITFSDSAGTANTYTDSLGNGQTFAINVNTANAYRFKIQNLLARNATWFEFNYTVSGEL
jgi:hypothetical protein